MNNVFEVSSLLESINNIFKNNLFLKDVWIRGEITDLRQVASSGHKYFQIKDDKSLIRCVYFRFLQNSSDVFEEPKALPKEQKQRNFCVHGRRPAETIVFQN